MLELSRCQRRTRHAKAFTTLDKLTVELAFTTLDTLTS
jgi:hypothetical protein